MFIHSTRGRVYKLNHNTISGITIRTIYVNCMLMNGIPISSACGRFCVQHPVFLLVVQYVYCVSLCSWTHTHCYMYSPQPLMRANTTLEPYE